MADTNQFIQLAQEVISVEAEAIQALKQRIDEQFVAACHILLACKGRVVVLGLGKSGHIGGKVAATLASTGTPAFFVHAGEASHGDLGMITPRDVVLAMSYSGETSELITLLPLIKRFSVPLVAITGKPQSTLGKAADVVLDISVEKEACPLGLAPTASSTATLVMGDALAVALLDKRGFTADDFALSHPGGSLGRRLLLRVDDIMKKGDAIPGVSTQATLSEALYEITQKRLGFTVVFDEAGQHVGVFTDGDLRRILDESIDVHTTMIGDVMTKGGHAIKQGSLAMEALQQMESHEVMSLLVKNKKAQLVGVLHMHDILHAGVV